MPSKMATYNTGMADRPGRVFDYGAFRHPTSPLFRDYLAGQPKALAFYGGGGWDLPALLEASRPR